MKLEDCIVYDVEVVKGPDEVPDGWHDPEGMGFASGVTYDYRTGLYDFYLHKDGLEGIRRALSNRVAITFNGIRFDSRVVMGNDRERRDYFTINRKDNYLWANFDILLEYIKGRFGYQTVNEAEERLGDSKIHDGSFNLDALCKATFGLGKTGHGAHAPVLYQRKQYDQLLSYNLQDVRLTRKLFDFIREYGFVVDRDDRCIKIRWQQ